MNLLDLAWQRMAQSARIEPNQIALVPLHHVVQLRALLRSQFLCRFFRISLHPLQTMRIPLEICVAKRHTDQTREQTQNKKFN